MPARNAVTRRNILKATSGSMILGASGLASATERVEVNVGFSSPRGRAMARDAADEVVQEFDSIDAMTIRVSEQATTALETNPNVRYVETNGTMRALSETLPWGVDRIDAEVATANGYEGAGADVAVVDTGIDPDHPDLQGNLGAGKTYHGSSWADGNGHGTHIAGTIAAVDNYQGVGGIAPGATLHAVKALSDYGSGSYSDIASAIEYAANQGWDVINLSLGGSKSSAIEDAVEYAYGQGSLLVGSAGGSATSGVAYPAAEPEVLAVSSTNENDELASFSSYGPKVELAAPGTDVYSTYYDNTYQTLSGTSMSAAHVSGAGAQVMAAGYSNSGTRSRLKNTAEDVGLSSDEQGSGLVDVAAALGLSSSDD